MERNNSIFQPANISMRQCASVRPYLIFLLSFCLFTESSFAQSAKYLVLFKDKNGTPYTISQPQQFLSQRSIARRAKQGISIKQRDLPVNPTYLNQVKQTGAKIWYSSRWLNAVLIEATTSQLTAIQQLSSVKGIEFGKLLANARIAREHDTKQKFGTEALDYGISANQIKMIGADIMHDKGYHGEGMMVAILDAGFRNSNTNSAMAEVFSENRVIGTYDFVKNEKSVYEDDSHGNNVFSIMGSNLPASLIGPAYKASYLLLRTEDASTETRLEEANWLIGAEYADSVGVDVINTSLGYSEFDNPTDDYSYSQMNGNTTLITRAADWAAATGMVVVVSAGNEGSSGWKYITAPADADSVLTVGAVNSTQIPAAFSSFGPSFDKRIKPDVAAQGVSTVLSGAANNVGIGNGTSYSAPLLAGLVIGFWQAFPHLSAMQVIDCIKKAGNMYSTPNDRVGYGIPTFERAAAIAQKQYSLLGCCAPVEAIKLYPNPVSESLIIDFGNEQVGKKANFQINTLTGQSLWNNEIIISHFSQSVSIPTSIQSGTYVFSVNGDGFYKTFKFIKL